MPELSPPTDAELRLLAPNELPAPDDPPLFLNAGRGGESDRLKQKTSHVATSLIK